MNISYKRFYEILADYKIIVTPDLQREFEWNDLRISEYSQHLIDHAQATSECLKDEGTLYLYQIDKNTFEIDDGQERFTVRCLALIAFLDIINYYKTFNNQILENVNIKSLKDAVNDLKNEHFKPLNADNESLKSILSNVYTDDAHKLFLNLDKKQTNIINNSKLVKAYNKIKHFYENLYNDNEQLFYITVDFILRYLNFAVNIYEYCSPEDRRQKYNNINNDKQDQSKLHRVKMTLLDKSVEYGLSTKFLQKYDETKIIFRDFTKSYETWISHYINVELLRLAGFSSGSKTETLKIIEKNLINNSNKTKYIIEHLFDNAKLYANLRKGKVYYKIELKKNNYRAKFNTAVLLELFSSSQTPRISTVVMAMKILNELFIIEDNNTIIGYKNENKANDIENFYTEFINSRIFNLLDIDKDPRSIYFKIIQNNNNFINNINEATKHLNIINKNFFNLAEFKETSFPSILYGKEGNRIFNAIVQAAVSNNDDYNFFTHCANLCLDKEQYDVDHIYFNKNCQLNKTEKLLADSIGNTRLLVKPVNRGDNDINKLRFIKQDDLTFAPEIRNKEFALNDIEINRIYKANIIKKSPVFYNYFNQQLNFNLK